jgi:hypothetical protein
MAASAADQCLVREAQQMAGAQIHEVNQLVLIYADRCTRRDARSRRVALEAEARLRNFLLTRRTR